jgi:hypothetical protein
MPNDWWRAMQQWVTNIMNSQWAYLVTETGLLALVEQRKPELHPYVKANLPQVWDWIRNRFFSS